jgi:hypothetical protein
MSTVGAAQSIVTLSCLMSLKISWGSTRLRQMFAIPRAVLIQVKVPVAWGQVMMDKRSHDIQIRIAVRDHHAFRPRCRPARVVDREKIGLGDLGMLEIGCCCRQPRLVVDPAIAGALESHEVLDARQAAANGVDRRDVVGVGANDLGAAVIDDVCELIGDQSIVDRHQHRADLGHRVVRLQVCVRVGRDVGDPVSLPDAELLQRR